MKKHLKPAVAVLSALSLSASAGEFPDNTKQGAENQKISQVKTETAQKTDTTLSENFSRKYFNEQHTDSQQKKEAVKKELEEILSDIETNEHPWSIDSSFWPLYSQEILLILDTTLKNKDIIKNEELLTELGKIANKPENKKITQRIKDLYEKYPEETKGMIFEFLQKMVKDVNEIKESEKKDEIMIKELMRIANMKFLIFFTLGSAIIWSLVNLEGLRK